jgi:ribosomal protein L37E
MHDRSEWTRGAPGFGRKKNLVEFTRPCATCGKSFAIHVTEKIADGHADTNSFGLKNCEEHRRNNRPAKRDLEAELAILYERDKAQFVEIQELRAKLAAYELFRK